MSGTGRRRRRRAGRVVITVAAVVAVAAGVEAATGLGFGADNGGNDKRGATGGSLPPATAKVTRQTLFDTQTEDGKLGHGDTSSATSRLQGTVTALAASGTTVKRGDAFSRIDNGPVLLLYGSLPAYRALSTGTKGSDVKQFEENLTALGYRGFTVDDTFTASTAVAVKKWQKNLGLTQTGTVELGRVFYTPGEIRVEAQKVSVGDPVQPGTALLSYTAMVRVVTVELDVSDQRLVRNGAAVSVKLPAGNTVAGKIAKYETIIKPAEGQDPAQTKIDVTITIDDEKALADLDQATVSVDFTATKHENVLTVPVAALLALSEGGYGVQVVAGGSTRILPVQTGMFAGGRVEVSGQGLTEGMTVGMPG
jgi:peptidoglycan hydrolase-like protein with peptidoglycan-binding domain